MEGSPARRLDYRFARIWTTAALVVTLVVLLFWDAANERYSVEPFVFFGLIGAILTLLGLEARDIIRGGG